MRALLVSLTLTFIPALANAEPRAGCAELKKSARFTVYFERVDLEKLVQTVSAATCRSFLVGENVKGKISIIGPENGKLMLDADQFYAAFLAALDVNGFTAVTQGRFTRIIEKPKARQFPVPLVQDGEAFPSPNEVVTRIFRLQHAEAEALRAPISAFVSQGAELLAVPPDVLIVTDLVSNLQRIGKLLETLDVEKAPTEVTKLITVKHAAADELLEKVTRALVFLTPHIIYDTNDFKRLVERKMIERTRLIEEFYGERGELERSIDFGRKPGPIAALARAIGREQARPENGGQGSPGDLRIEPAPPAPLRN